MPSADKSLGLLGSGINESLAGTAGLPVDAMQALMNLVRMVDGQAPVEKSVGGSEWIKDQMGKFLATVTPETTGEKALHLGGGLLSPDPTMELKAGAKGFSGALAAIFAGAKAEKAPLRERAEAIEALAKKFSREEVAAKTGWHKGLDDQWRFEIDDSKAKFKIPATGEMKPGVFYAKNLLDHPELFKQYPFLKDYPVYIKELPPGVRGAAGEGSMAMSSKPVEGLDRRKTLLHELQHRVQRYEGFERGGSPSDPELGNYARRNPLLPKWLTKHELYKRLAGEMEARAVEARMWMDAATRRAKHPFLSLDRPEYETILRGKEPPQKLGIFD